jgi:transposase
MGRASSLPPSADVSLSEVFTVARLDPLENPLCPALRHLPIHVEPQPDEALVSWLGRLAARYGMAPLALAEAMLGRRPMEPRRSREAWWQRPGPDVIRTISWITGIPAERVRATTFEDWAPFCRQEGAPDRFSARHFRVTRPGGRRMRRFLVCPACLAADQEPYIRKTWTLGWVEVCGVHRTVMFSVCPTCHRTLRFPDLGSRKPFAPGICTGCGTAFVDAFRRTTHEAAVRLQDELLDVKRLGSAALRGLGVVDWPTAIAAADVLLGAVWIDTEPILRRRLQRRIADDLELGHLTGGMADGYGALLILAWLFDEWPGRLRLAMRMLRIESPRELIDRCSDLDADMRLWLLHKLGDGRGTMRFPKAQWSAWLASMDAAGMRARARRERYSYRRIRLLALADVRDGKRVEAVANSINVQPDTVYRWLQEGAAGGLEAALDRRSKSVLSSAQQAELSAWIADGPNRADVKARTAKGIQIEARSRFGIELSMPSAGRLRAAYGERRRKSRRKME